MERTLVLIKPDAFKRGLVGEIISRFEGVGLKKSGLYRTWFMPRQALMRRNEKFLFGLKK